MRIGNFEEAAGSIAGNDLARDVEMCRRFANFDLLRHLHLKTTSKVKFVVTETVLSWY